MYAGHVPDCAAHFALMAHCSATMFDSDSSVNRSVRGDTLRERTSRLRGVGGNRSTVGFAPSEQLVLVGFPLGIL